MTAYTFHVTCPRCGRHLEHRAGADTDRTQLCLATRAIAACAACNLDWLLTVELSAVNPLDKPKTGCGTENGYKTHIRHKIPACEPCREAHKLYVAEHSPPGRRHRAKGSTSPV